VIHTPNLTHSPALSPAARASKSTSTSTSKSFKCALCIQWTLGHAITLSNHHPRCPLRLASPQVSVFSLQVLPLK
jgi:hypothetical protein